MSLLVGRKSRGILESATGAWKAGMFESDGRTLTDLSGNKRHARMGGSLGPPTANDPDILSFDGERYFFFDGHTGNYVSSEDVNLLDTRQSSFDNVAFDQTVLPQDRYEVWGSGGGSGEGALGSNSPFLVDLESYRVAGGLSIDGVIGNASYAETAASDAMNALTDFEVVAKVNIDSSGLTETRYIASRRDSGGTGSHRVFTFYVTSNTQLGLQVYDASGGGGTNITSNVGSLSGDLDTDIWLKATWEQGLFQIGLYKSYDGQNWTELKIASSGNGVMHSAPAKLRAGGWEGDNSAVFNGTIYEVRLGNLKGGSVYHAVFEGSHITPTTTSFVERCGNTVTISGNATLIDSPAPQVAWFPNVLGERLDISDGNLLSANEANFNQSRGSWSTAGRTSYVGTGELVSSPNSPWGGKGVEFQHDDNGASIAYFRTNNRTVKFPSHWTEGHQFTVGVFVERIAGARPTQFTAHLQQFDSTPTIIKNGPALPAVEVVEGGVWLFEQNTVGANVVDADIILNIYTQGVANSDNQYRISAAVVMDGYVNIEDFVPSAKTSTDLDIRYRLYKDWSDGDSTHLFDNYIGGAGYLLSIAADGRPFIQLGNGVSAANFYFDTAPFTGRQEGFIRHTRDAATGDVRHYYSTDGVNWIEAGQSLGGYSTEIPVPPQTMAKIAGDVTYKGTFLYHEVRDGIDGPVVSSSDLTKTLSSSVNTGTTPEGHTLTIVRSGVNESAEIIDRDTWVSASGSDRLEVPDRGALNIDGTGSFVALMSTFTRNNDDFTHWFYKLNGPTSNGGYVHYNLNTQTRPYTGLWDFATHTSQSTSNLNPGLIPKGQWSGTGFEWDNVNGWARDIPNLVPGNWDMTQHAPGTDMSSPGVPLRIMESATGLYSWFAIFRRGLQTSELDALAAWDGSVENEPSWIRPLAVFYINANDPWQKKYYDGTIETNSVLNLATAPYGELGWNVVNNLTGLSRDGVVPPVTGHMVLKGTMSEVGGGAAKLSSVPVGPISSGESYRFSCSVRHNAGVNRNIGITTVWYDSDDGEVSRESEVISSVPSATWQTVQDVAVAPSGATRAGIELSLVSGNVASIFVDAVTICKSENATGYIPSLRIREDLDVEVDVALDTWTPSTEVDIISEWGNSGKLSWRLTVIPSGNLLFKYSEDGTTVLSGTSSAVTGLGDRQRATVRVVFDSDDDTGGHTIKFYVNGSQLGASVVKSGTSSLYPTSHPVEIGSRGGGLNPIKGRIYSAKILDGIVGPVAYELDLKRKRLFRPPTFTSSTTLPTGQKAVVNKSVSVVTSDRLYFDGRTAQWLQVDDSDGAFNIDRGDDMTVVFVYRAVDDSALLGWGDFISNGTQNAQPGWRLERYGSSDDGRVYFRVDDGVNVRGGVPTSAPLDGSTNIVSVVWDRSGNDEITTEVSGGSTHVISTSPIGDTSNSNDLIIGSAIAGNYMLGEFFGAAVFRSKLTSSQIKRVGRLLGSNYRA